MKNLIFSILLLSQPAFSEDKSDQEVFLDKFKSRVEQINKVIADSKESEVKCYRFSHGRQERTSTGVIILDQETISVSEDQIATVRYHDLNSSREEPDHYSFNLNPFSDSDIAPIYNFPEEENDFAVTFELIEGPWSEKRYYSHEKTQLTLEAYSRMEGNYWRPERLDKTVLTFNNQENGNFELKVTSYDDVDSGLNCHLKLNE